MEIHQYIESEEWKSEQVIIMQEDFSSVFMKQ